MDITPYYIDARNAITQPEKMVFLSQYFRRHWMPTLGPLGTAIVIFLRGECYHNRKSGELRDSVQLAQREIAAGCGCSVPTLKRELERNAPLKRFVQVSAEWERDASTGRVRQVENHYKVAMDDPLTETDEARLREMVDERISREREAREREAQAPPGVGRRKHIRTNDTAASRNGSTACSTAVSASGSNATITECSNAVNNTTTGTVIERCSEGYLERQRKNSPEAPVAQTELLRPTAQIESTPIQNELLYSESLLKTTQERTLNVERGSTFVSESEADMPAGPTLSRLRSKRTQALDRLVEGLVAELHDFGSERRHYQLLDICQQRNLDDLPKQALSATRKRLVAESRQGPLEKPGAYYQSVLIALLEDHQVFVPKLGEPPAEEVHRLALQSLKEAERRQK